MYKMAILYHGDCLEEMKQIESGSVDLIFCDLPYGQTSCSWDKPIDLDILWSEYMRIKKLHTPLFFTTTTKYGVNLINSAPKKCSFKWDVVWVKSRPCGFLNAKRMPMRSHEMVYVFYEKLPMYDLSSHKHKFIDKDTPVEPKLPTSVIKEDNCIYDVDKNVYGGGEPGRIKVSKKKEDHESKYEPKLPTSVIKEKAVIKGENNTYNTEGRKKPIVREPAGKYKTPLPTSVIKEEIDMKYKNKGGMYSKISRNGLVKNEPHYDPPLPKSVLKEEALEPEPELPNSVLEIKSKRGKHSTQKPVELMKWILKYFSKEGDVVVDNCMGSGSMGVACKEMNRNFIGIELDPEIYEVACERIHN